MMLLATVRWADHCPEAARAATPTGKPNVLIVLTDFHNAPVCTPTRGQLLTGRDAMHNGAWSWAYGHEMVRRDVPTIADMFKANGYRTGHFGKWHLGDNYPYPKEANTPMVAAFPATEREFKKFPACQALPVAKARLKIGDFDRIIDVRATDEAAVFVVDLPKCSVETETWLLDANGKELCGAYYVDVTRQGADSE